MGADAVPNEASRPGSSADVDSAPELQVAFDLARRAVLLVPVALAAGAIGWGVNGALSALLGVGLAAANLLLSAVLIARAARISANALMAAVLGGFLVRFAVLTLAVVLLRKLSFVEDIPLLFTVLVTHIGLLVWETRHVSLSFAYPGLKPPVAPRKAKHS